MIKKVMFFSFLLTGVMLAEEAQVAKMIKDKNIYERTCIPCHRYLPRSLENMFMRYLQTFSGETTLKVSLKAFLKKPMEETSVMTDLFIDRFSVKDKTLLSDKQLDEAIDIYWDLYNVRNKLK